jgi:uncharacterized membrane protein YjjP (DUF1212 family)
MTATEPVERALDVALIVMRNGGSTVLADRVFGNILKGFKRERVPTVWRIDFVAATTVVEGRPSTIYRPVGVIGINLVRASEAARLSERVARGEIDITALDSEIERVKALDIPYNRWVLLAAGAGTAAVFSQFPGKDWGALGISFVAAGVGQFLRLSLQERKMPVVARTLACGVLSTCLAAVGLRLNLSQAAPWTMIASVVYMVPGLPLINGFIDTLSHRFLFVGLERIANAVYIFLILAVAIAFASTVIL